MPDFSDIEGNPLRLHALYSDHSLLGTNFQHTTLCFVESYTPGDTSSEDTVILRYETGLTRKFNCNEKLIYVGRRNARGDVTFEGIRSHANNPSTQEEAIERYGTTNLDAILTKMEEKK